MTDLEPADLANLARSGISPELARQAKLTRVDSAEGGLTVGRNGAGDYAGILIPNILPGQTHAREHRLRRDHPDIEYKDGRQKEVAKYLTPPGRANLAYFVPGTPADWLSDTALPALITEGEKKALALWELAHYNIGDAAERPRWLPIGIPGVWNWKGTIGKTTGPDGGRRDVKGVIPDIERVNWKRRKVTIAFDVNSTSNSSVEIARVCLTNELRTRGAEVFWFQWPDDTPASVNGIDDLLGLWGLEKTLKALKTRSSPVRPTEVQRKESTREFVTLADDHHRLILPEIGIKFDIDRLRRERHELIGELCVHCDLPGARVINGTLSIADFNLSSARARSERAKLLADRANTRDLDWLSLLEEFCQRVLQADRNGQPGVDLRQLPRPDMENDVVEVDGFALPRRHPSILFGDGGAVKSYTGLYFAGRLAMRGMRVALFDWELVGDDHRDRLERLFGVAMPRVVYVRCERPLVYEADRLRRIVRDETIEFCVYDSVAFASDGPPEAAEVASRYFRAVRQIGAGSLHIAHVNKSENANQKPFGSSFWHNGARSTWFAKRADDSADSNSLRLGLFNKKANLGALRSPIGFIVTFTGDRTQFRRAAVADNAELASQLSVRQRMVAALQRGQLTVEQVVEEIEANAETVRRMARRYRKLFVVTSDGRLGLLANSAGEEPEISAGAGGGL